VFRSFWAFQRLLLVLSVVFALFSFSLVLVPVLSQVVVMSGSITVLPTPNVTVNVTPSVWFDDDLPTAYGLGHVRSSSRASDFLYGPSVSSFSVASGGNVTMIFLNTFPVGCALDSVRVSFAYGKFGKFGPFGSSSDRFWVYFGESSDPDWRFNVTLVHNRLSHEIGVFFAVPVVPSGRRFPWGFVYLVSSVVLVVVIGFLILRILRIRSYRGGW